mgnify:CR=1 FL=1
MTEFPTNALFNALRKIPTQFDLFLIDAGLTRAEWNAMDNIERNAYWRLFGPDKPSNCIGEGDYDGDGGRGAVDEMNDNRRGG